jgi:hypothetical protein
MKAMLARAGEGGRERAGELLDKELEVTPQAPNMNECPFSLTELPQENLLENEHFRGERCAQVNPRPSLNVAQLELIDDQREV